jgi:hypothetical protein
VWVVIDGQVLDVTSVSVSLTQTIIISNLCSSVLA